MVAKRRLVKGIPISAGVALGQSQVVLPGHLKVAELPIGANEVKAEIAALEKAVQATEKEIRKLRDAAGKKMSGAVAKVFDAQLLIASDKDFLEEVKEQIRKSRRNAGFVYNLLLKRFSHHLNSATDQHLKQMAEEIEVVGNRILSHLSGMGEKSTARLDENTILVAKSFGPGDILSYRQRRAIGFIASEGGTTSHMALIARSLLIPLVVLPKAATRIPNSQRLIVDGTEGIVIVNPTDEEWGEYLRRRRRQGPAIITRIKRLGQFPPQTADGHTVEIAANMEVPGPVDELLSEKRVPIGLYRTEFLYLESDKSPDEHTQFQYYYRIAEKFQKTDVVFRTFDLGSDKVKSNDFTPHETNPALGWRGIRSMLDMSDVFKTQVRAILRASVFKNVKILLPMITDITELRKAKRLISQVMLELRRDGESFDEKVQIGIMVEVPAAALTARQLVLNADFVSIGTNDLTQYTMSADRGNKMVADLYNPYHPSVLSLVAMTVDACRKQKVPVGVCGEMAGDPLAVPLLVGMGINTLSMNPTRIVDAYRLIRKVKFELVRHLVEPVLTSRTASSVVRKLQNYKNELEKK